MSRYAVAVLAVLLASTSAHARGGRRPSSAVAPPPDWAAIRAQGEKDIRALLVPWLEARKSILTPCDRCEGAGQVPRPGQPGRGMSCPDCRALGIVLGPDFDPAAVDAPLFHRGNRAGYWARIRESPPAARRIAIADYRIREVRVLGDVADVMVEVRLVPFGGVETEWTPDVTSWHMFNRTWKVMDPDEPPSIIDWGGGMRLMPESLRPKPVHEPAAFARLDRALQLIPDRAARELEGLSFRVEARIPDDPRAHVLTATWSGGRFSVRRKRGAFAKGTDSNGPRITRAVKRFLDAALSPEESVLPPMDDYHLDSRRDSVVMRGFSPHRFMETVTVEFDSSGFPRSVTTTRPGRPTVRLEPRFEDRKGQIHLAGAVRIEGEEGFEFSVVWRKDRRLWLPSSAEVRLPGGPCSLTLTPSWPKTPRRF